MLQIANRMLCALCVRVQELALPPSSAGFTVLRLPLRDLDDEDITSSFGQASDFIHQALGCPPPVASSSTSSASVPPPAAAPRAGAGAAGGRQGGSPLGRAPSGREGGGAAGVLVHCSQGQSRSVALVAAYLVAKRRMRLATALNLIRCEERTLGARLDPACPPPGQTPPPAAAGSSSSSLHGMVSRCCSLQQQRIANQIGSGECCCRVRTRRVAACV